MADPYYRYAATSDTARAVGGSVPRSSFPGYLSSEASFLAPHQNSGSNDLRSSFPGYLSSEASFLAPHQNSGSNDPRSSFPGYLSSEAPLLASHQNSGSNDPRSSFPGYLSSDAPLLASHHNSGSNDRRGVSSDFVQRDYQMNSLRDGAHGLYDIPSARVPSELVRDGLATGASKKGNPPGSRGLDDISGTQVHPEPGLSGVALGASLKEYPLRHGARGLDDISGSQVHSETPLVGLTSGASMKAYPLRPGAHGLDDISGDRIHSESDVGGSALGPSMKTRPSLEHPNFLSQRQDVGLGSTPGVPDVISERPSSQRIREGLQISEEPNILFVDGLPTDCTRREVGHLFRPFIGFKDIRVVHKEPRRTGDRAMVLCFVEFSDSKCARTALEALQGYKFDDKKPDSPTLRIHFAHFPFRLPSDGGEQQIGIRR